MGRRVHLLVEGMYLRADSVARDAYVHHRLMRELGLEVELFAERFDAAHYPGVHAQGLGELEAAQARAPALVVYHWVDGWREAEALLQRLAGPLVIRWHNNTPPWFFAPYSPLPTHKTLRGFEELLRTANRLPSARFWVNSYFSREQLILLGIAAERIDVLQPVSPLLDAAPAVPSPRADDSSDTPIRLLFVGRIVPHKGQLHLIAAAAALQAMAGKAVEVVLPGRGDADMPAYPAELTALGRRLGVKVDLAGEVGHERLAELYRTADVFVGLSEHEGFGLPILEAIAHDVPVVAYRNSAVAETVVDHPLALATLDPVDVARRILAAIDPAARTALTAWQRVVLLPRFSNDRVARQLHRLLAAAGLEVPRLAAEDAGSPAAPTPVPPAVEQALARALALPAPTLSIPRDLPRDQSPHYVTHWDLRSYRALLRSEATGELRERALRFGFHSHRGRIGGLFGLVKKLALRVQDGLVRTLELSHGDLEEHLRTIEDKLDALASASAGRPSSSPHSPASPPRDDQAGVRNRPATP